MSSSVYSAEYLIKENHIDTFGHMNNAAYLSLFEEARWDLVTSRGYSLAVVQKTRQGPVILEVNLKFLREIHLREKIKITVELLDYLSKVGHLKQQMIKDDGTVAAEAVFTFGLFDLKERKLIAPTPPWKTAVGLES